jgi:hypothetical protein
MAQEPAYQKQLLAQGNVATFIPPADLAKMLSDDITKLGKRLKASGINLAE